MLKTRIEKLEDVAEPLRDSYEQSKDGKGFVLKVEGDAGDVFPGLTANQKALLDEKKKLSDKIAALESQYSGLDVEEAKKLLTEKQKLEEEKAKQSGQWENWKAQMQQQFDTEKAALAKQIEGLKSSLHQEMVGARATAAIAEAKGVPALLLPHIGADVVEEDGKPVVRIVKDGKVRYGKSGEPMTIAERIAEMREDEIFGRAFEPVSPGGSGAQNGTKAGTASGHVIKREDAKDPYKYRAAKEAAEKAGQEIQIID